MCHSHSKYMNVGYYSISFGFRAPLVAWECTNVFVLVDFYCMHTLYTLINTHTHTHSLAYSRSIAGWHQAKCADGRERERIKVKKRNTSGNPFHRIQSNWEDENKTNGWYSLKWFDPYNLVQFIFGLHLPQVEIAAQTHRNWLSTKR